MIPIGTSDANKRRFSDRVKRLTAEWGKDALFDTLDAVVANRAQAGYGDLTKLQGALVREGNAAAAAAAHPRVDRIYACEVLDGPAYDTFVAFEPDPDAPRVEDL